MKNVDGLDELNATFAALERELTGPQLVKLTESAADVIYQEVIARAPEDTGALKASIESVAAQHGKSVTTSVDVADSAKGGIKYYAVFLEYGTAKMAAKPFMRPAFEAKKNAAVQKFTAGLQSILGKTIK